MGEGVLHGNQEKHTLPRMSSERGPTQFSQRRRTAPPGARFLLGLREHWAASKPVTHPATVDVVEQSVSLPLTADQSSRRLRSLSFCRWGLNVESKGSLGTLENSRYKRISKTKLPDEKGSSGAFWELWGMPAVV